MTETKGPPWRATTKQPWKAEKFWDPKLWDAVEKAPCAHDWFMTTVRGNKDWPERFYWVCKVCDAQIECKTP